MPLTFMCDRAVDWEVNCHVFRKLTAISNLIRSESAAISRGELVAA